MANPPLQALTDGEAGGNGLYRYGASGFPTSTFTASNYWVDAVFTPSAPPPPSGAPILVVTAASNPLSRYYAEILRAEGLNAFELLDIAAASAGDWLAMHRAVVILGQTPLTAAQVTMFIRTGSRPGAI